jgi:MYXO-CTERM domain-containing protein
LPGLVLDPGNRGFRLGVAAVAPHVVLGDWEDGGHGSGSAYAYTVDGTDGWSGPQVLRVPDAYPAASDNDLFGESILIAGDLLVVNQPEADISQLVTNQGAVHFFRRTGAEWVLESSLVSNLQGGRFGTGLAVDPDGSFYLSEPFNRLVLKVRYDADDPHTEEIIEAPVDFGGTIGWQIAVDDDQLLLSGFGGNESAGSIVVYERALALGSPCGDAGACHSGVCVDGVCCDSTCGGGDPGDCLTCIQAAGAEQDGLCTAIIGQVCRPARDACDAEEVCAGGESCPADAPAPAGTPCDDGLACSTSACIAGACEATGGEDCDDLDPCTNDSCSEPDGCAHEVIPGCLQPDAGPPADAGPEQPGERESGGGCGCTVGGSSAAPGWPIAFLVLLVSLRRRRRGAC